MLYTIRFTICFVLTATLLFTSGCSKDNKFLNRESGTWEIESMQIDYLNSGGGVDSSVAANITGFFMFYDTPTTGDDPFYLCTNGITVKGIETHTAHFYRSDGSTITLVYAIGQAVPDRAYAISERSRNEMTIDYSGSANGFYSNYTGLVKEHIVLKRIKF